MEQILINLIAGALGGVGAGKSSPNFDLGTIGNIVSGLVGGGVLGQIVTLALPGITAAAQSGDLSIGGIISHVVAGGAGGAILTAIIGAIKNRATALRPKGTAPLLVLVSVAATGGSVVGAVRSIATMGIQTPSTGHSVRLLHRYALHRASADAQRLADLQYARHWLCVRGRKPPAVTRK